MPALGALLKGFVVPFLVLFNKALQADIAPDLDSEMVTLQEHKEPGHPAVAVTKRVDAQKIQVEGGQKDKRRNFSILDGIVVQSTKSRMQVGALLAGTVLNRI